MPRIVQRDTPERATDSARLTLGIDMPRETRREARRSVLPYRSDASFGPGAKGVARIGLIKAMIAFLDLIKSPMLDGLKVTRASIKR